MGRRTCANPCKHWRSARGFQTGFRYERFRRLSASGGRCAAWQWQRQRRLVGRPRTGRRLETVLPGHRSLPHANVVSTVIDVGDYRATLIGVDIISDPDKRAITLKERGLDFDDAGLVFAAEVFTRPDDRKDYGEDRFITTGYLAERCVMLVWTPRGGSRRIISMRYAHADEERLWRGAAGL